MAEWSLSQLQRQFKNDILTDGMSCSLFFKEDARYSAERRMDPYRWSLDHLNDFLLSDFPILKDHLGEDSLTQWLDQYLRQGLPGCTSLVDVGAGFSHFLHSKNEDLLSEIAAYDWAQTRSALAPYTLKDYRPITELADLEQAQLVFDPTLQLFQSSFAVHTNNEPSQTFLAIRFVNGKIEVEEMERSSFVLLRSLKQSSEESPVAETMSDEEIIRNVSKWVQQKIILGFYDKE